MISARDVAFFLIVHVSTHEKNCLQYLIPTGPESGGKEGVSYSLKGGLITDGAPP